MDLLALHKQMTKSGPNPWRKLRKKNSYTKPGIQKAETSLPVWDIRHRQRRIDGAILLTSPPAILWFVLVPLSVGVHLLLFSLSFSVTSDSHGRGLSRDSNRHFSPLMKSHGVNPCTLMAISNHRVLPFNHWRHWMRTNRRCSVRNLAMELMQFLRWRQQRGGTQGR